MRLEDIPFEVLRQRQTARLLHHEPQQDRVGVAVLELLTRLELHGVLEGVGKQLLRGERPLGVARQRLEEVRIHGVVEEPAAHPRQFAQRDPVPVGNTLHILPDRIVEADLPPVDQGEHRRHRERLGHAADPHVEVGRHGRARTLVGDPEGPDVTPLAGSPQPDRDPRHPRIALNLPDRPVQPLGHGGGDLREFLGRRYGRCRRSGHGR